MTRPDSAPGDIRKTRIMFDAKLKRPGCVLLQAAIGGEFGARFHRLFPTESWLTKPTPDMRVYLATDEELEKLGEIVRRAMSGTDSAPGEGKRTG
jgi:hypothetical protein